VVADGTRILGAVVSGSIDASMMSGFGQVFPAVERGAAIKVLAGGALLPGVALFSAKPEVRTLKDLEGRAIGTGSIGALIYQLTVGLLEKYKVDTSRIRFANIGSSTDIFRAVATGTVDGGLADAALIDTAAEHHVHLVEHGNLSSSCRNTPIRGRGRPIRRSKQSARCWWRALAAYAKLYRFVQDPHSREAFMRARRSAFPTAPETDHLAQWHYIQTYKPFAVTWSAAGTVALHAGAERALKAQRQIMPFERIADMSLAADAVKLLEGKPTSRG